VTGDSIDLIRQCKRVLLEMDAITRVRRQAPRIGFSRRLTHAGHPTKASSCSNAGFTRRIPGTATAMSDHMQETEQQRAEMRERLPEEAQLNDDESNDPEGHEPLPGLVGDRIKKASEPDR